MVVVGADAGRSEVRERQGMRRGGQSRAARARARHGGVKSARPDPVADFTAYTADRTVSSTVDVDSALDAGIVGRILDNLLSNAIDLTPVNTPMAFSVLLGESG